MTDEELIEQVARALNSALAFAVERDVYAGETTHEERCAIARAILPIIKAENERLREALIDIVEHCANWGYGNPVVNERIVDRCDETARAALKENTDASSD